MFRRSLPTALAVALSLSCIVGASPALADPVPVDDCAADVSTTCAWSDPAVDALGSLEVVDDQDWWRFTAPQAGEWVFMSSSSGGDVYGELHDSGGALLQSSDDWGGSFDFRLAWTLSAGETVYVAIGTSLGNGGVDYTIWASHDDCASSVLTTCAWSDPPWDVAGFLETPGDSDWWRFTAPQAGLWTFTSHAGGRDVDGYLYDVDGTWQTYDFDSGDDVNFSIAWTLSEGETVYVAIRMYVDVDNETGPYTIHAECVDCLLGDFAFDTVSVSGGALVGQVLTATPGAIVPTPTLVSYQWLRAGEPIAGATQSTYTLTTKDMCLQLSVRVTVSKSGYTSVSKTSAAKTGPVFTDVPSSHTFYSAICWVAQTGVTVGTGAGMYSPSDPVNRGSMAAFLYRMAGSPAWTAPVTSPFVDVPKSHKFYKEITWLSASGITVGVVIGGKTYYEPDNAVNRGSMSAFMYRLSGSPSYTAPATAKFADVATTHTFYKTISWLASKNITAGTMVGGQLLYQPSNPVNRGSMAAFLNRLANQHLQCATYPNGIQCSTG